MPQNEFKLDTKEYQETFRKYLDKENNNRIVFSGKFGSGKTFLLKEFFESNKDDYYKIILSPINYSILSNEDIFKILKYDIFINIVNDEKIDIKKEIKEESGEKRDKLISILWNIAKVVPNIGSVITSVEKLYDIMNEKTKDLQDFEEEKNFIHKHDYIDELIEEEIKGIKEETVLIIDDLDRLDPEHIFRILNVFSGYTNSINENNNKLGFDKIIIVCDVENIRNIFHHRYGEKTDFKGYFGKFISTGIFKLSLLDVFIKNLEIYFEKLEFHPSVKYIIKYIIEKCYNDGLDIRSLTKIFTSNYDYKNKIDDNDFILSNQIIYFLSNLYSNDIKLLKDFLIEFKDDGKLFEATGDISNVTEYTTHIFKPFFKIRDSYGSISVVDTFTFQNKDYKIDYFTKLPIEDFPIFKTILALVKKYEELGLLD